MANVSLRVFFHPIMKLPEIFDTETTPFVVPGDALIVDLMDIVEEYFQKASVEVGNPLELQINILWNVKEPRKALNPNRKVSAHFATGDTFGVYGDVLPLRPVEPMKAEEDKIPVTILTGFLGSGKTTLLNYILQEQREKKIAVIENEFGEISIDDALLKQEKKSLAEKIVVMGNGCMCCTIRGDLVAGLQGIIQDIKNGNQIDAVLIETTGMADPVPIVRTFMAEPSITRDLRLDAVVAMADAKNLPGRLADKVEGGKVNEAYQQIAFADKIILNKLDLITTEEAIAVKDQIRAINKYAKVLPAIKGRVRMDELANIRAHDMTNFGDIDREADAMELEADGHGSSQGHGGGHGHEEDSTHGGHGGGHGDDGHGSSSGHGSSGHGGGSSSNGHGSSGHGKAVGHGNGHGGGAAGSRHDGRVNSFAIVKEGEIAPRNLGRWMQILRMLPEEKGTIFRVKAILAVQGHPYKFVYHAVMDVADSDDAGLWGEGEKKINKIVFIGKSMDEPFLRSAFEAIVDATVTTSQHMSL